MASARMRTPGRPSAAACAGAGRSRSRFEKSKSSKPAKGWRRRRGTRGMASSGRWRPIRSLARAAKFFSRREAGGEELLRKFLAGHGLRAPSEAKLVEMLRQLSSGGARTRLEHDGMEFRTYRNRVFVEPKGGDSAFGVELI